jgi:hypothetical protein
MPDHDFKLGFRAVADELGAAVVGTPLEPEQSFLGGNYQTTTTGLMFWSRVANRPLFLPSANKVVVAPPVPPTTPTAKPWDKVRLIKGGFSTWQQWGLSGPRTISAVVWHTLEGYIPGALSHFDSGAAGCHFIIANDGAIWLVCQLEHIAWHAGTDAETGRTAFWKRTNLNHHSIGIECEGFAAVGINEVQVSAAIRLGVWIRRTYSVPTARTTDQIAGHHAHSDISNQRGDPGPKFPWDRILGEIKRQAG